MIDEAKIAELIDTSQERALKLLYALRDALKASGFSLADVAERTELPEEDLHEWLIRGDLDTMDVLAASRVAIAVGLELRVANPAFVSDSLLLALTEAGNSDMEEVGIQRQEWGTARTVRKGAWPSRRIG